jgi:hypothetical protein
MKARYAHLLVSTSRQGVNYTACVAEGAHTLLAAFLLAVLPVVPLLLVGHRWPAFRSAISATILKADALRTRTVRGVKYIGAFPKVFAHIT